MANYEIVSVTCVSPSTGVGDFAKGLITMVSGVVGKKLGKTLGAEVGEALVAMTGPESVELIPVGAAVGGFVGAEIGKEAGKLVGEGIGELLDTLGQMLPDNLYIEVDGHKVWPSDSFDNISSDEVVKPSVRGSFNSPITIKLKEWDVGRDDNLGELTLDPRKKGVGQLYLFANPDEGDMYEVVLSVYDETSLDTLPHEYADTPSLYQFESNYLLFCNGRSSNKVYAYRSNDYKTLDNVNRSTIIASGEEIYTDKTTAPLTFNGLLFLFYKDRDSSLIRSIYSSNGGGTWRPDPAGVSIPFSNTDEQPAVAVYNDTLYVAFKRKNSNDVYYVTRRATQPNNSWSAPQRVHHVSTDAGPSLCVYDNKLYLAFKDDDSHSMHYVRYTEGKGWSDSHKIPNDKTSETPQLLAKGDMLYVGFKGDSSSHLYLKRYDGDDWESHRKLESDMETDHYPTMINSNVPGQIYMAYREDGTRYPKLAIVSGLIY